MSTCEYHLNQSAIHYCPVCDNDYCKQCADYSANSSEAKCIKCNSLLEKSDQISIENPFWRRLEQSFRYPFNLKMLSVITVFVLITGVLPFLPFTLILTLVVFGTFFKYVFTCLKYSSAGDFSPPSAVEALEGGLHSAIKVIGLFLSIAFLMWFAFAKLNYQVAVFLSFSFMMLLPAIMMIFSFNESIIEALNPVNSIKAALALGIQYLAFIGFIFVMAGSAGVLNSFINTLLPEASGFLTSCVTLYYLIVAFHIMGYMVYENQHKIFPNSTGSQDSELDQSISELAIVKANMHVKEGNFKSANEIFAQALKSQKEDFDLHNKYFEFLLATNAKAPLRNFAGSYFAQLISTYRKERLYTAYKSVIEITGELEISQLKNKVQLARACYDRGNYRQAIKLLKNAHITHAKDEYLLEAYELMHDSLVFIPGQEKTGHKVYQFIKQLKRKQNAGTHLINNEPAQTDSTRSLKPKKRINLHENKELFQSLNKNESLDLESLNEKENHHGSAIEFTTEVNIKAPKDEGQSLIDQAMELDKQNKPLLEDVNARSFNQSIDEKKVEIKEESLKATDASIITQEVDYMDTQSFESDSESLKIDPSLLSDEFASEFADVTPGFSVPKKPQKQILSKGLELTLDKEVVQKERVNEEVLQLDEPLTLDDSAFDFESKDSGKS